MEPRWALLPVMLCGSAMGQQTIGRVALQDAMVTGTLEVEQGQATLRDGGSIVARDHTAKMTLNRGGVVEVCATSSLHVTSGTHVGNSTPLLFALDRGAIELRGMVESRDVLITPDLRFSTPTGGAVDLRVRVTSNGDTCVENRGGAAPTIEVVEQFGDGRYLIPGGQHVLFEHGSIREVVDRESSPCGCPPTPVMSLAESGVTVAPGQAARAGGQVAAKADPHPFPAAQSQGLAETTPKQVPQAPAGEVHAQVAATMAFGAGADSTETEARAATPAPAAEAAAGPPVLPKSGSGAGGTGSAGGARSSNGGSGRAGTTPNQVGGEATPKGSAKPVEVKAPPPPAPPGAKDIAHRLGRFFKRIFGAG